MSTSGSRRTVWLFDLDNTLHNASASSFGMLSDSMRAYIEQQLSVSAEEANRLRGEYWKRYGATLLGLIRYHGVKAPHFLAETHRLPGLEAKLRSHPRDLAVLKHLPGRKYILTNAPRDYALRVLKSLGIEHGFDGVFSIESMRMFGHWRPKPDTRMFRRIVAVLGAVPSQCVLVEDTLEHQKAARSVGLQTVWMQRWVTKSWHGPEVGVRLRRRPRYVCARMRSLQNLRKRVRHD